MTEAMSARDYLIDHYHCTFFLPLIGLTAQDLQPLDDYVYRYKTVDFNQRIDQSSRDAENREIEAQAYRYFSPALRDILFDCQRPSELPNEAMKPVEEWRLPEKMVADWRLILDACQQPEKEGAEWSAMQAAHEVYFHSIRLYRYFNGVYVLAFTVIPEVLRRIKNSPLARDSECKVHDVLVQEDVIATRQHYTEVYPAWEAEWNQLSLESWLHFTRLARVIYPSFPQQEAEKKIAPLRLKLNGDYYVDVFEHAKAMRIYERPGADISPILRALIAQFSQRTPIENAPEKSFFDGYTQLFDDRLYVSVAYGIAGKQLPEKELQRLNALTTYVDREWDTFSDLGGYVYKPESVTAQLEARSLDYWQGLGGYYSFTDFSNSYLSRGGFFSGVIAPEHIIHIYDRMLLQALFYQASLRYYDQRICDSTTRLIEENDLDEITQQRREFIQFTNQYWFHEVTQQMQGREIFRLQQQALGLKAHYGILQDEIERTNDYLQAKHDRKLAQVSDRIGRWGMVVAIFGLYYTLLPLLLGHFSSENAPSTLFDLFSWVSPPLGGGYQWLAQWIGSSTIDLFLVPSALCGVFYLLYHTRRGRKT